jgi:hypothetical protein
MLTSNRLCREAIYVVTLSALLGGFFTWTALGAELKGTVTDRTGRPKQLVRVEVRGPQQSVTATDKDGRFTLTLPPGSYVVQIREGTRVAESSVTLSSPNITVNQNFGVPW